MGHTGGKKVAWAASGHKRQGKQGVEDFLPRGPPESECEVKEEEGEAKFTANNIQPYSIIVSKLELTS